MPKNYDIRGKLRLFERFAMLDKNVIVTKPNNQIIRGKLVWVKEDGWAGVETYTGFVEWVSLECGIEVES